MPSTYPHSRRRVGVASGLAIALVVTAVLTLPRAVVASSAAGPGDPVTFSLPAPTGPHQIGTLDLHLIDHSRTDPWADAGGPRELMISIWYPALHRAGAPTTPWLPPRIASYYNQTTAELGIAKDAVDFAGARSHAQTRAAVATDTPRPVVFFSPGGGMPRSMGTVLVEELASHGYVVITVDSTYQAPVEFPAGLTMPARGVDLKQALAERVRDLSFVLDEMHRLRGGENPDVDARTLPEGLGATLDLDEVGIFGHSMGGFASAEVLQRDDRFAAGANLDGSMGAQYRGRPGDVVRQPFLLIGTGTDGDSHRPHTHRDAPDWAAYWEDLHGWKRNLYLPEGEHMSFTDLQAVLPAVGTKIKLDDAAVRDAIGTVDPDLSVSAQRRYLVAFFDQQLRGRPQPILDAVPADLPVAELVR